MEFPLDKETMRSFLGMINYLNRYPALSAHLTAPLSALTHQATDYKPGKVHFENFNRLKVEISNMRALPYFDVNAETTLQMDASKKGLRVCLIQKGYAHIGERYVLLEKNGLSNSSRCLLKILPGEEIAKLYICIHLRRTIHDCNRVRPATHYQKC